ncbi:MAG: gluconate 2-dehydrogenase subunit 3 family protein [Thalassotalea sp.]
MQSFFEKSYQTPSWLKNKLSRRQLLKSAAGASAIASLPRYAFAAPEALTELTKTDPWLTLDTVFNHLLPSSASGPGAAEIQASNYLYQTIQQQPIGADEITFIYNGVGWLNGYSNSQLSKTFVALTTAEKETILRGISGSTAGENWLNTLINYLYEAMLSPPIYGGNPNGVGWQWLKHQAGFPLPAKGQRYYEIPGRHQISVKNMPVEEKTKS